ncbi:MAG: DUF4147 domain-containing protein [Firmicutes bacterium]|nr:DUF4147 domain-containing protein [Bacillota bacterium]
MRILNLEDLCSHGNINGRKLIVEILEAGLKAADPYNNTKMLMRIEGKKLIVGSNSFKPNGDPNNCEEIFDLDDIGRIYVLGAGKGVQRIAKAIEDVLGDHLTGGHVIDKKGNDLILEKIGVTFGAHPIPDEDCVKGCKRILAIAQNLKKEDLVFTIAANGISSLLTLPAPGVSLEDIREVTRIMQIEHGAPTSELNSIRNHLDLMKGGKISKYLYPAKMVHIIAFPPGEYDSLLYKNSWLHTLPDYTTFQDAVMTLKRWGVWDKIPHTVKSHLEKGNPEYETPKANEFEKMSFRIFGVMPEKLSMLPSAEKKAMELGLKPIVLAKDLQAEASQIGSIIATIAVTSEKENQPFQAPCALFTTGEALVTVGKEKGIGGRNQEYVLSAALKISGSKRIIVGAVDSDGTDGPGSQLTVNSENIPCLAGGIVDGDTLNEAKQMGIDLRAELKKHNTSSALWKLKSGVVTNQNISLNDLGVTLILK